MSEKVMQFSYFLCGWKNWLMLHNNNNYKKMKIHDQINGLGLQ